MSIAVGQYTIVDLNDPVQSSTEPSSPVEGMLWIDLSVTPYELKRWNGTSWEVVNDLSSISVGGKNLLLKTNQGTTNVITIQNQWAGTLAEEVFSVNGQAVNGFSFTFTSVATSGDCVIGFKDNRSKDILTSDGEKYTLSFDFMANKADAGHGPVTHKDSNGAHEQVDLLDEQAVWQYVSEAYTWEHHTYSWTTAGIEASDQLVYMSIASQGHNLVDTKLCFCNFKLEKGGIATDWTPAPEDVEESIQKVAANTDVIVGTQTATTASWTGIASFSSLVDKQQIVYWLPQTSSSNATLNLTLSDGSATGAVPLYFGGTTRLGTQYAAGNAVHLVYRENVTIGSTTIAKGWWADANYDTNDRVQYKASVTATGPISAGRLGVFNSDGYLILLSTTPFNVTKPILYVGTAFTASALTQTNNFIAWGTAFKLSNTVSGFSGTAGAAVYIKGTLDGYMFTPATGVLTTTVPTEEDGYTYILLGLMSTTTDAVLAPEHPMYRYVDGAFKSVGQISYEAQVLAAATSAELDVQTDRIDAVVKSVTEGFSETEAQISLLNGQIDSKVEQTDYDAEMSAVQSSLTEVQQTAEGLSGSVSKVSDALDERGEQIDALREINSTWFTFDTNGLTIGKSEYEFKARLSNDRLAFLNKEGVEVAYFSNKDLYITDATVLNSLRFGNIQAVPDSNSNALDWIYVG